MIDHSGELDFLGGQVVSGYLEKNPAG